MAEKKSDLGYVDIPLSRPMNIDGAQIKVLRMREPTVADQLASEEMQGRDSAKEIAMFANLCEISPDDIKRLTLKDYKKLQVAFMDFIG